MTSYPSGSQTVGPYFAIGLNHLCGSSVMRGEVLEIKGRLLDENLTGIPDACLEIWQADSHGHYRTEPWNEVQAEARDLPGFARVSTDLEGRFFFTTVKPGAVPYHDTRMQAPHLVVLIFMRGLLRNLITRMYFPDELANDSDPILQLVPIDRRGTLIAQKTLEATGLVWTIITRGEAEAAFFDW